MLAVMTEVRNVISTSVSQHIDLRHLNSKVPRFCHHWLPAVNNAAILDFIHSCLLWFTRRLEKKALLCQDTCA